MAYKKWLPTVAFGLLMLLYLVVPMKMILSHEQVLQNGTVYKFRPIPRDPLNPFMGRYLTLNFRNDGIPYDQENAAFEEGDEVYLKIAIDSLGYAFFNQAMSKAPVDGDYFISTVDWAGNDEVGIQMPFNRYYLNEKMAPEAEKVFDQLIRSDSIEVYASVRIMNGQAVLEELYFNDQPVERFLAEKE